MMHVDPLRTWVSETGGTGHSTTPAGLQSAGTLRWRRRGVLAVNVTTCLALLALTGLVLGAEGWSAVDLALFACCGLALPWTVMGFWNAAIGLRLLAMGPSGLAAVAPFHVPEREPIRVATAVVMTLRNEDPGRALARLERIKASLDANGEGAAFAYHILSDSDDPAIAVAEELAVAACRERYPETAERIFYRRRPNNCGFKAGNLQDFCRQFGDLYELMLPLDADSVMDGACILRLVRIMQAHPRIGILQSLVVGMASQSPFARIFQFGMRQGMRPYTMGAAWWMGDCGPFWGHNALVRITPFAAHCRLPDLPDGMFGGPILSHDQIEAVLMRRAGYEVRVLPVEGGSFEENPPTLFDHVEREARWCFGNLQYVRLMGLRGLPATSRFQLAAAVMMFLTPPALTLALLLLPLKLLELEDTFPAWLAASLYLAWLVGSIAPKLAGYAETLASRRASGSFGGRVKFASGALVEIVFSLNLFSVICFWLTLFMAQRLVSWRHEWGRQNRDIQRVDFALASRRLWPCSAFGLGLALWISWLSPTAFLWSLPLLSGHLLCIPLAFASAAPALGALMVRSGLCSIPEELGIRADEA
ncbi:glucans biosynthesis glucosyltransferase MdoH [Methylobacterium sp. NEAU K]|uniref:glucans biosynthesis glucosyltransferase MdoH n=1 Tax=Methylobacterium sp. NEAU K TaxID=3064946 RepID=UPI0027371323|nr:glucans biosynthesis glucosyltransferase MdoH [Methylobacterium sp. NEAU K]MDP4006167.1 glucans biosynthesis glucosyltransferase MdoH [Methylobacterium sp. NEAU K]